MALGTVVTLGGLAAEAIYATNDLLQSSTGQIIAVAVAVYFLHRPGIQGRDVDLSKAPMQSLPRSEHTGNDIMERSRDGAKTVIARASCEGPRCYDIYYENNSHEKRKRSSDDSPTIHTITMSPRQGLQKRCNVPGCNIQPQVTDDRVFTATDDANTPVHVTYSYWNIRPEITSGLGTPLSPFPFFYAPSFSVEDPCIMTTG